MKTTSFFNGGQPLTNDTLQRMENDKNLTINALGSGFGVNTILQGCTVIITPINPAQYRFNITSGVCYVVNKGVTEFQATNFVSSSTSINALNAYVHTVVNPAGTIHFYDSSVHNAYMDTLGVWLTPDQPTTGLINCGSYPTFKGNLATTYAPLAGYTALNADYNTFKNTTVPTSYLLNSTASATYLTQAAALTTYRKIGDSWNKAETQGVIDNSLLPYFKLRMIGAWSISNLLGAFWAYPYTNMPSQPVITGTINSTGYYTVIHNLGNSNYIVLITTTGIDNKVYHAPIIKNNNNFVIKFYSNTGVATDQMFDCIVLTWL